MDVIEKQDGRGMGLRQAGDEIRDRLDKALRHVRVVFGRGHRVEQLDEQGRQLRDQGDVVRGGRPHDVPKTSGVPEPSHRLQVSLDRSPDCAKRRSTDRGAAADQPERSDPPRTVDQLERELTLAEPRLTLDQNRASLAAQSLTPTLPQPTELGLPTDQSGVAGGRCGPRNRSQHNGAGAGPRLQCVDLTEVGEQRARGLIAVVRVFREELFDDIRQHRPDVDA